MYGAIIELFGVRDKVEYNHMHYTKSITSFKNAVQELFSDAEFEVELFFFRDFCYLFSKQLVVLIDSIRSLQYNLLLTDKILLRASLVSFRAAKNKYFKNKILGLKSNLQIVSIEHECGYLFTKMIEIKGIGVSCEVFDDAKSVSNIYFQNFYIYLYSKTSLYQSFRDIKIGKEITEDKRIYPQLEELLLENKNYSKISTYFIPFLINIIKVSEEGELRESDSSIQFEDRETFLFIDNYLLGGSYFAKGISTKGIELVISQIIDNTFSNNVHNALLENNYLESFRKYTKNKKYIKQEAEDEMDRNLFFNSLNSLGLGFSLKRKFINYYYLVNNLWFRDLIKRSLNEIPHTIASKTALKRFLNECYSS